MTLHTGPRGLALIKVSEGLRLHAYQDSVGVWTIGYGHTGMAGAPSPRAGMTITADEAEAILKRDLIKYETAVLAVLKRTPTQNQFDAMVSLCFNIGPGNFAKSRVVRYFNQGAMRAAAQAFMGWTKAGGIELSALVTRRRAEAALFLS